jgi:hypothetical protein
MTKKKSRYQTEGKVEKPGESIYGKQCLQLSMINTTGAINRQGVALDKLIFS